MMEADKEPSYTGLRAKWIILDENPDLTVEQHKLLAIRWLIYEWIQKQGHDRCWYYPEIFRQIAILLDIDLTQVPQDVPYEQFVLGCKRYQFEQYGGQSPEGMPKA